MLDILRRGVHVSDYERPHVPRRYKQRLRQDLYYSERFGLKEHLERADI